MVVIDHFDSFTYNLVVAFENLGATVQVLRTNATAEAVRQAAPTHIVLSPGPGHPRDVPLFQQVLEEWKAHIPIIGVCLGHQAIGIHFGAEVVQSSTPMHGKTSEVEHIGISIFSGLPNPMRVCRYHSLVVLNQKKSHMHINVLATSKDASTIMGIRGWNYPHVIGVQFHPESFFTEHGSMLLANFLKMEVEQKQMEQTPPPRDQNCGPWGGWLNSW